MHCSYINSQINELPPTNLVVVFSQQRTRTPNSRTARNTMLNEPQTAAATDTFNPPLGVQTRGRTGKSTFNSQPQLTHDNLSRARWVNGPLTGVHRTANPHPPKTLAQLFCSKTRELCLQDSFKKVGYFEIKLLALLALGFPIQLSE